jgi:hypothetical protein
MDGFTAGVSLALFHPSLPLVCVGDGKVGKVLCKVFSKRTVQLAHASERKYVSVRYLTHVPKQFPAYLDSNDALLITVVRHSEVDPVRLDAKLFAC